MTKNKYSVEILTRALDVLNRHENYSHQDDYSCDDLQLFLGLSTFMSRLKDYLSGIDCALERQNKIEVFQVLTEISFDKLERDIMGVN